MTLYQCNTCGTMKEQVNDTCKQCGNHMIKSLDIGVGINTTSDNGSISLCGLHNIQYRLIDPLESRYQCDICFLTEKNQGLEGRIKVLEDNREKEIKQKRDAELQKMSPIDLSIPSPISQEFLDNQIIEGQIHKPCGKMVPSAYQLLNKVEWGTGKEIPSKVTEETHCFCWYHPDSEEE